jgi:predicted RNase H-related nuclease YkuK (DUF458 family)|tara:strand:- start:398 stop:892 length:495 start_codon:yes stop_codon:yes gene_type:complete
MIRETIHKLKEAPSNSRLYLGADSIRFVDTKGIAWAKITVVAVIHLAGSKGCQVVGETTRERVYDKNLGKPQHRMMTEVQALAEIYLELENALIEEGIDCPIEVHLDIASEKQYGSNCAAKAAAGYILGVCGVSPILKPEAWAASTAADLFPKKLHNKTKKIAC